MFVNRWSDHLHLKTTEDLIKYVLAHDIDNAS